MMFITEAFQNASFWYYFQNMYLIFDGKAIQGGGQVVAHGFFLPPTENLVLVDFHVKIFSISKISFLVD